MSTPPSDNPRLPDADTPAAEQEPDLDRDNAEFNHGRLSREESHERLPEADE